MSEWRPRFACEASDRVNSGYRMLWPPGSHLERISSTTDTSGTVASMIVALLGISSFVQ